MSDRVFLQEPDLIRIVQNNRAKRAAWALYLAILVMGLTFLAGYLVTP